MAGVDRAGHRPVRDSARRVESTRRLERSCGSLGRHVVRSNGVCPKHVAVEIGTDFGNGAASRQFRRPQVAGNDVVDEFANVPVPRTAWQVPIDRR